MGMRTRRFTVRNGLTLLADESGPESGLPVVLLHGGGQTRGSWKNGAASLAEAGYRVVALDTRGHGESSWAPDGDYSIGAMTNDLRQVLAQLPPRPALVGASMGGMTALCLLGEPEPPPVRALVLVDIVPRFNRDGANRILEFMTANSDGFTSVEEAADAVAAYNTHRPRPKDISGLRRNLREQEGRFYWHWDPVFISSQFGDRAKLGQMLEEASGRVNVPAMLVRGALSDLVGEAEVQYFRELMPHAEFADVAGAGHMVAGDRNDAFNDAILSFLQKTDTAG